MSTSTVGLILVVLYTVIILAICIRATMAGPTNTGEKFFLGSGTKTFVLLFTTLASTFSTWVFMGAPASTYTNGHTWIALVTLYQMSMVFTCGYLGPRFWKLRHAYDFVSQADLVVSYYGQNALRFVMGGCFMVAMVTGTIAQFKAMGTAISVMSNGTIPYWAAALYVAVVIAIYVCFGGFHGEALVDTFQGILFTVVLWGGLFLVVAYSGGLSEMFTRLASAFPEKLLYQGSDAYWGPSMAISFSMVALFGGMVHPGFWQRYYAAKDTHTLTRMSVWLPIMTGIGVTLSGGLVGLAANLYNIELTSTDAVFQVLLSTISSPYWGVAVCIGILAAGMSTVAGNCNCASMVITYDFIRNLRKDADEHRLARIGKLCVLVVIALGYLLSLNTPSSVTLLIQLMAAFNMAALYPVLGIFVWKRATAAGCLAAMIGQFITICITNFVIKDPLDIIAGGWGLMVGMVLFVVVSLVTKPVSDEKRAAFFAPLAKSKRFPQTVIR